MKIQQVEEQVGITKKNIRFYEREGHEARQEPPEEAEDQSADERRPEDGLSAPPQHEVHGQPSRLGQIDSFFALNRAIFPLFRANSFLRRGMCCDKIGNGSKVVFVPAEKLLPPGEREKHGKYCYTWLWDRGVRRG